MSLHQIKTFKVLEMGPLRFSKGDLYKTFPAENVTFHKGDILGWQGLVNVTINSPFLNIKGPISKTFNWLKV